MLARVPSRSFASLKDDDDETDAKDLGRGLYFVLAQEDCLGDTSP